MTWKHFSPNEFKCPCCGIQIMDEEFISKLDRARTYADVPFVITSGYRCLDHNKAVGGSCASSHLRGLAADISAHDGHSKYAILAGLIKAGITRIGLGRDFIHADVDPDKIPYILWLYEYKHYQTDAIKVPPVR